MSIAGARSGQNAEIEKNQREWRRSEKREKGVRKVKSSFDFSQKQHPLIVAVNEEC